MSTHRLDTDKLLRDVDRVRRRGQPGELSYRRVAAAIGVSSSMFTRLGNGERPDADSLCSLLRWLNPQVSLAEYTVWVTDGRRDLTHLLVPVCRPSGAPTQSRRACRDTPLRCRA